MWPWDSLETRPRGAIPRYPPRGVLRDWSRPVPGSCREVLSPLTGDFPDKTVIAHLRLHKLQTAYFQRHHSPISFRLCERWHGLVAATLSVAIWSKKE